MCIAMKMTSSAGALGFRVLSNGLQDLLNLPSLSMLRALETYQFFNC